MTPVIFYHEGRAEHLEFALQQCKKFNKDIILIGNEGNKIYQEQYNIKWVNSSLIPQDIRWERFISSYVHLSYNPEKFEIVCFKRFFVIYQYILNSEIDRFIYLDSDILSYAEFDKIIDFNNYDFGSYLPKNNYDNPLRRSSNCGISFWKREVLNDMLSYFVDVYENKVDRLKSIKDYFNNKVDGISDMTLEAMFILDSGSKYRFCNLGQKTNEKPWIADYSLCLDYNYEDKKYKYSYYLEIKKIIFKDKQPYFQLLSGELIKVVAIHFQGDKKRYMKDIFLKEKIGFSRYLIETKRFTKDRLRKAYHWLIKKDS